MEIIDFVVIFITLLFSAFFSGMEIAFVSSSKLKIEVENKEGKLAAKIYSKFLKKESNFIGAMLVGNNIALVMYGVLMAKVLEPWLVLFISSSIAVLLIQTLISTLLVLVYAEFLPKTIFRINPNKALNFFCIPVWVLYNLLRPIVFVTIGLSNLVLKVALRTEIKENKPVFGKVDLDNYLQQVLDHSKPEEEVDSEVQIFQNALGFSDVKARECMVPRTEIVAIEIKAEISDLKSKFIETGLSKILVYKDNIDNIIGYTKSFDLFRKPAAVKNIVIPISIVPETMPANETLDIFINNKKGIAVVVDEFGGTSGMITLEDLVEEIFGEIEDEHDKELYTEQELGSGIFKFSARLEIDYLNEKYKLGIPDSDEYETLAGYIINNHESIPEKGEALVIKNFQFEVLSVSQNRIDEVVLTLAEQED
ncbi:MAG: HlyC/CorC family transporter [Flavobacteriales bacterium]|nr:HlyC/CorC family transporter [Flavobacteriales bacterium]MBT6745926.1 HlyC/CorC family transporter [Flavobacteriales bacterium]